MPRPRDEKLFPSRPVWESKLLHARTGPSARNRGWSEEELRALTHPDAKGFQILDDLKPPRLDILEKDPMLARFGEQVSRARMRL